MKTKFKWSAGATVCPGSRHIENKTCCQDAARASSKGPRPLAIVTDGRGSSNDSQIGSKSAVRIFEKIVRRFEPTLKKILDSPNLTPALVEPPWIEIASKILMEFVASQRQMSRLHRRPPGDFEFTLAAVVIGDSHTAMLQVGDSCIALVKNETVELAFHPTKGAYENETEFVGQSKDLLSIVKAGIFPTNNITGLFCFTDGLASKWIDNSKSQPAPAIVQITKMLSDCSWSGANLRAYLTHDFWDQTSDDDRGVGYLFLPNRSAKDSATTTPIPNRHPTTPMIPNHTSMPKITQSQLAALRSTFDALDVVLPALLKAYKSKTVAVERLGDCISAACLNEFDAVMAPVFIKNIQAASGKKIGRSDARLVLSECSRNQASVSQAAGNWIWDNTPKENRKQSSSPKNRKRKEES